jgi:hypothetical protein
MPVVMPKTLMMTAEMRGVETAKAEMCGMQTAKAAAVKASAMPNWVRRGFNSENW